MRTALWVLVTCASILPAADVFSDFPLQVGNEWTYEHEDLSGDRAHPDVSRWTTVTTVRVPSPFPRGPSSFVTRGSSRVVPTAAGSPGTVPSTIFCAKTAFTSSTARSGTKHRRRCAKISAEYCWAAGSRPTFAFPWKPESAGDWPARRAHPVAPLRFRVTRALLRHVSTISAPSSSRKSLGYRRSSSRNQRSDRCRSCSYFMSPSSRASRRSEQRVEAFGAAELRPWQREGRDP
jgi:hypothetical protein